jgi:hypothetical protein
MAVIAPVCTVTVGIVELRGVSRDLAKGGLTAYNSVDLSVDRSKARLTCPLKPNSDENQGMK